MKNVVGQAFAQMRFIHYNSERVKPDDDTKGVLQLFTGGRMLLAVNERDRS